MVFSTHISISFLCAVISLHLGVNFKVKQIQADSSRFKQIQADSSRFKQIQAQKHKSIKA
ncbi:hypothetical protein FLL92_10670 [Vibrio cholerae]|nr:hypothetical protein FLL92_10670 [Vibrio cholerae]